MTESTSRRTLPRAVSGSAFEQREIRLALVLNGGVSLAVWIGGVVAELDRARRAGVDLAPTDAAGERVPTGDPLTDLYGALLDATGSVLRTDVIAGASAGGLNGCLLATAVASGGKVDDVRDTWVDLGSFRSMLRSGLDPDPPSILKGDDYFLVQMEREFGARLSRPPLDTPHSRVDLFVTGTDLLGEEVLHRDDFGGIITDREHRAVFHFTHDPRPDLDRPSDFEPANARQLSRVARSTASFPGAFEPSYCRVSVPDAQLQAGEETYSDLRSIASFSTSRWVIDGGVLDNAPFRPALGAIARAPAAGHVRRVLCYVTPYASPAGAERSDLDNPPAFAAVVGASSSLPRDLTFTETLESLEEYRERVRRRRQGRERLIALDDATRRKLATTLFESYCNARLRTSCEDVLRRLLEYDTASRDSGHSTQRPLRPVAEILSDDILVPWVPMKDDFAAAAALDRDLPTRWGIGTVAHISHVVLDLFSQVLEISPPLHSEERAGLTAARRALSALITETHDRRDAYLSKTQAALGADTSPFDPNGGDRRALKLACDTYADVIPAGREREMMREVARATYDGAVAARALLAEGSRAHALAPKRSESLIHQLDGLTEDLPSTDPELVLARRLLAIEVIQEALNETREHDQRLDFMRINAEAVCELDGRNRPEHKLTGLGLNHFAAFYKRSWRANDWMWGRLDGASRLVEILLEPRSLRLAIEAAGIEQVADLLVYAATGRRDDSTDAESSFLEQEFQRRGSPIGVAIRDELNELASRQLGEALPTLEQTKEAVRRRLQLLVATQELPVVAQLAASDPEAEGSAPDSAGAAWARAQGANLETPTQIADALRRLRIAESESLGTELGSNLLTRNLATVAAVGGSALSGKRSGLPVLARVGLRAARGLLLGLYALTWALTSMRSAARTVGVLALLVASAVIAWGIASGIGDTPVTDDGSGGAPGWLAAIATLIVAAGLLLGVVRGGRAGIVVALAFVTAYFTLVWKEDGGFGGGLRAVFREHTTIALVLAIAGLGALAGLVIRRGRT